MQNDLFIAVIAAMVSGFTIGLIGGIVITIELMGDICWLKHSGNGHRSCVDCVMPHQWVRWLRKLIHPWETF